MGSAEKKSSPGSAEPEEVIDASLLVVEKSKRKRIVELVDELRSLVGFLR